MHKPMSDERLTELREMVATCMATPELAVGPIEAGFLDAMTDNERLRAERKSLGELLWRAARCIGDDDMYSEVDKTARAIKFGEVTG